MDIGPTIVICILILVATMAISFLLSSKFKLLKYFCWIISSLLLIFITIITPLNISYNRNQSRYLFGEYTLDLNNSKYHSIVLAGFKSLTLTVKDNYTFATNDKAPFLTDKNGTWLYWVDGDEEIIKCKFKSAKYAYSVTQNDSDLIFESNILLQGIPGDKIAFKKIGKFK